MITPHKHMNLDCSVLRVSALMIREVAKRRTIDIESLRKRIVKKLGVDAELIFVPALNFLFLLDRIVYHPKNDTLEFKEG
jgi:hypothetical protein